MISVSLAGVYISAVLVVGAEGFVWESSVDLFLELGHDWGVCVDLNNIPRDRGHGHVWEVELDARLPWITT